MANRIVSVDSNFELPGPVRQHITRAVGDVHGGQILGPVRVPHLVVDDTGYPTAMAPHRVLLWAEPSGLMYASDRDRSFYKSTDHGRTWTRRGRSGTAFAQPQCFLKLATGTLIGINQRGEVERSTDDGATWTVAHTFRSGLRPMAPPSWAEDPTTGHVYFGEYTVSTFPEEIRVYRSTDDAASFDVFHTFPGPEAATPQARHIHNVEWDQYSQRMYVTVGDSEPTAGIYRTNADATALEPVVTNDQIAHLGADAARAIGLMFFPDYIAWGVDGTVDPNLIRMHRSQIGATNPQAEVVYRLNATAWFTIDASPDGDGTTWLLTASREGDYRIDNATHVYAVEDNGARVFEVGTYPQSSTQGHGALAPVGKPQHGSDRVWLQTFNMHVEQGAKRYASFAARLARGTQPISLAGPPVPPPVIAWQTVSSGRVQLDSTTDPVMFGMTRTNATRRNRLLIHDWGVARITGSGAAYLEFVDISDRESPVVLWSTHLTGSVWSQRISLGAEDSGWIVEVPVTSTQFGHLVWQVRWHTGAEFDGIAQVTYGWAD